MKIIILGAGRVGANLAENLANERHDVTVVDIDSTKLGDMQDRLDIGTVRGHASHPDTLRRAGADDADILIAVTHSDEVNMMACQVAYTLFHTPTKIARIRAQSYQEDKQYAARLFQQEAIPVDMVISPEQLVTDYIRRLIQNPGALQVVDFADGAVRLVGVKAWYGGGPLVGQELSEIRKHIPNVDTRVAAIYREGEAILPKGDTVIEADDEVFFLAARKDIRTVMSEIRKLDKPVRRIMLAGGGRVGARLAKALEQHNQVKVIERDGARAREIADELDRTIVLHGDAASMDLLQEENIQNTDVFCAVTNDDEANILSAMLAKRLGARKVMALINRPSYVDLVQGSVIDIAISPQTVVLGNLLAHVRRGDVVVVHSLRRGAAEAMEAVAHGDERTSKVVGRHVEDVRLPPGVTIGAIVRGEQVIIAHHDTTIQSGDHVILFMVDKSRAADVAKLFQVGVGFF